MVASGNTMKGPNSRPWVDKYRCNWAPVALPFCLPSSLCAPAIPYPAAHQLLTPMAICFCQLCQALLLCSGSKNPKEKLWLTQLGQLSTLNRSTVTKRTKCKKHGGSLKSLGLDLGEGKRKTFPQKMGDICSQKREKTTYRSPVLPRMKANKAFKSEVSSSSFRLHHSEIPWTFRFSSTLIELLWYAGVLLQAGT